jgi:hypothetical protein
MRAGAGAIMKHKSHIKSHVKNIIVGIDLAGKPANPTGFARLTVTAKSKLAVTSTLLYDTVDIVNETLAVNPDLVCIDAPLTLPRGRCCLNKDCSCAKSGRNMREVERVMYKRKIRIFPPTFAGMKTLTLRGMELAAIFHKNKLHVIEVYPGSTQDILGIPRKHQDLSGLQAGLKRLGIKVLPRTKPKRLTQDELDAITSAYTGYLYLNGQAEAIGDPEEGVLIVPLACK